MIDFLRNEKEYLQQYIRIVEEKLNWGESEGWRHQDFESLGGKIFEETGVMLSSTTLKRIWGKLKYDSIPNSNTLNALASFIGYSSWLEFKSVTDKKQLEGDSWAGAVEVDPQIDSVASSLQGKKYQRKHLWLIAGLVFLVAALAFGFMFNKERKPYSSSDISKVTFTSNPVADGIPNTVVFKYDVSHLSPQETAIQQSWDKRLRFEIDPLGHEVTSTYYYPGYFRAKLLVDGQITKEHDLYLKSDGWLVTLNKQPEPRYFLQEELKQAEYLGIKKEAVMEAQSNVEEAPAIVGFHYVDNFGELQSDNFVLEASIKNTYQKGDAICQWSRVVVLCTDGAFLIPFSIPGCVGDLRLIFNDVTHEGSEHDLSAFGCDFSAWQKFRCEVRDREVQMYLNDRPIYELAYQHNAGRVVGLRFLFKGDGEVDEVSLKGHDGRVYFEDSFLTGEE